jgi:zinc protease
VQAVLDAELADVVKNGVTAAELSRAKNLTAAGFWKKLATIDGKAQLLGEYEVFHGDWAKLFAAPGQFEKVTREEIHAVARDILDRRRRTAGVLMPTSDDAEESADADIDDADLDVSEDVEA